MAQITITTTPEERGQVLKVLIDLAGATVSVSAVAKQAKMNPNRVRYVIADLEEAGKINKIPTKVFNKHYARYKYEIVSSS
jgi:DNA-binding IclR family transcriptional regulator